MSTKYLRQLHALLDRKSHSSHALSIDRIKAVSKQFNDPFNNFKCIHVAGTNGKGSVCHKLSSILESNGYKTGLSISPHISSVRERIQINNIPISENDFIIGIDEIFAKETPETELSFFELITLLSFNYFAKECVDYAVIEVGLGGRLDATNIITKPSLSVITSISLDHTAILGDTVGEITKEKGGIIKECVPVVIGPSVDENIIRDLMMDRNLLQKVDKLETEKNEHIDFDEENQEIVRKCMDVLRQNDESLKDLKITKDALLRRPMCRFEVIRMYDLVDCVMDCAHNLNAMERFCYLLKQKYDFNVCDFRFVVGMSKGKNVESCLKVIDECAKFIHFVSISDVNKRSLTVEELKQSYLCNGNDGQKIIQNEANSDCGEIMQYALDECIKNNKDKESNKKQILVVVGSLYIMSNARQVLKCNDIIDSIDFSDAEFGHRKI